MMIPVRIILPLYIRSGAGRSFSEIGIAPASGKVILMDGVKEDGLPWKGISKWYFKINNKQQQQWYWGGRVEEVAGEIPSPEAGAPGTTILPPPVSVQPYIDKHFEGGHITGMISYSTLVNIDEKFKKTRGRGAAIAILDSAISKAIHFNNPVIRPFSIDPPNDSHGSFLAGVIAGTGSVSGISPDVELIELPLYDSNGDMRLDHIDSLFDFIESYPKPVILNVSQDITPVVRNLFQERFLTLKNAIVVAAAGIDTLLPGNELNFPASLPDSISVGALSKEFVDANEDADFNQRLDFILPSFDYVSYTREAGFESDTDTSSVATAVVSSVAALLISVGIKADSKEIKEALTQLCLPFGDKTFFTFLNLIKP